MALQNELETVFHWFHQHPELALNETETTKRIKEELSRIDGVELLDLGLPTGALARVTGNSSGPVVLLRADIDALPITEATDLSYRSQYEGKMHACGHDFHTTCLLGVARILAEEREKINGTVLLLFQPAEEDSHGAGRVVGTGLFKTYPIKQVFGLHVSGLYPVGTIAVCDGPFSAAVDRYTYTVTGVGCHGAHPDLGLDPIVATSRLVTSLQEIVSRKVKAGVPAVVSVTRFTSGTSWNIIPQNAELEGTVRTFDPAVRDLVKQAMEAKGKGLEAEGYHVDFQWVDGCPASNNDPALTTMVRDLAKSQGFLVEDYPLSMGGEDFSCYQEIVPGSFFMLGTGLTDPAHSPTFVVDPAPLSRAARLLSTVAEEAVTRLSHA